jgi:hypothetical protein
MILSLDFLQFTIHNHDSAKSTTLPKAQLCQKHDSAKSMTQKHDPEIFTEAFCSAGILN